MSNSILSLIDEQERCSCRGYHLDKLLQPSILILLVGGRMHGYLIIQALEEQRMLSEEKADNAGIYRALKTLEERELVRSEWIFDGAGPAKREYAITEKGRACLAVWMETLEEYEGRIRRLIRAGRAALRGDLPGGGRK